VTDTTTATSGGTGLLPAPSTAVAVPRITRQRRTWILLGLGIAFAASVKLFGIPLDRTQIMLLCIVVAMVLSLGGGRREGLGLARDFLAIGLLLAAYDRGRGAADEVGWVPVQYRLPIDLDRSLTGTVPTLWLQQHLYDAGQIRWWEVLVSLTYISHFVAIWVVLTILWVRRRDLVRAFTARFLAVTALTLVGYVLLPQAPPWLAAQEGYLAPVSRTDTRGFDLLGLHFAGRWLRDGAAQANPVAAMPSLHSAYPLLFLVFFYHRGPRRLRPLLVAYPLMMTFTLVASGEHYLVDVLAAWLLVGVVHLSPLAWRRARGARAGRAVDPAP
jgi:hypothetical protein